MRKLSIQLFYYKRKNVSELKNKTLHYLTSVYGPYGILFCRGRTTTDVCYEAKSSKSSIVTKWV